MSGRYAVLTPDWQLRGYSDTPAALVNWRTGQAIKLLAPGSHVARSCDGATDFTAPFFLPTHTATLDLMIARGMAVECPRGTTLDPRQRLRAAPNRWLRLVNWFVTGRCNLRCRHCYMDAPTGRYGELPTADMLRIVDQLEEANVQRVHLTGGEALLRADIWKLIAELTARRIGLHQISTNGLLLDERALARLRALDVEPILHFSFDGLGTHDAMRGLPGVEGAALAAIRRAAAAGFRTAVTSTLDAVTRDGILRTLDVLVEAGVHTWHVTAPLPIGRWTHETTGLSHAEQAEVCETVLRDWLDRKRPFALTLCGMYSGSPGDGGPGEPWEAAEQPGAAETPGAAEQPAPAERISPADLHCDSLWDDIIHVMPDGRVIPCPKFIDTPIQDAMPSLLDVSLSEVWEDAALRELTAVTKGQVLERNPECAACPELGTCRAGCWAVAWAATGDRLGRDPAACARWKGGFRRRLAAVAAAPRR